METWLSEAISKNSRQIEYKKTELDELLKKIKKVRYETEELKAERNKLWSIHHKTKGDD